MKGCGRTCGCEDACPRAEAAAEERVYGIERDTGMSDREADRYERWLQGDA